MSTKVEFTIKQKNTCDPKWLGIELHEALDEKCLTSYWNEMIEDSELIPMDDGSLPHSKKGFCISYQFEMFRFMKLKNNLFCFIRIIWTVLYWSLACKLSL